MQNLWAQVATVFGVGHWPKSPGTWGTLVSLPAVYVALHSGPVIYMLLVLALIVLSIKAAGVYQELHSKEDPSEVVIDEVVGIFVAMTWLPLTWQSFVLAFAIFRVLDIFKPFPIGYLDRKLKGGFGIVADDLAAGLITNIILQVVYTKTNWLGVQLYEF